MQLRIEGVSKLKSPDPTFLLNASSWLHTLFKEVWRKDDIKPSNMRNKM